MVVECIAEGATPVAGPASPPAQRLAAAMAQHQAGELAVAAAAYRSLLAENSADADATHFLGMLRFEEGAAAEGLDLVQRSLALAPENSHAWNNLGNMLMHLGRWQEAEPAYRRATAGAPIAPAWYNLSMIHMRRREFVEALACLREATRLSRGFLDALQMLAGVYYRLDRPEEARDVYQQWVEEAPEDPRPRHFLAAISGRDVPERAADGFIVSTFDRFAKSFDEKLEKLEYRAPQLIAGSLAGGHPLYQRGRAAVLDAGCGTGWCGPLVRSTARHLVGVDLSVNMLERARARAVYDELHQGELTAFIGSHPQAFDIIVSADVLCYFGRLDEVFGAARAALRPGGLFAFTVEALLEPGAGEDFRLQMHGRYAHSRGCLERLLARAGFPAVQIDQVVLRQEFLEPVHGYLVAAAVAGA
jgi:predicted TPR repeat methyltransferase